MSATTERLIIVPEDALHRIRREAHALAERLRLAGGTRNLERAVEAATIAQHARELLDGTYREAAS